MDKNRQIFFFFYVRSTVLNCQDMYWTWYYYDHLIRVMTYVNYVDDVASGPLVYYLCSLSDCIAGLYGTFCEKKCSQSCQNDYCNKTTGFCLNGCRSGYLGNTCNQSKGRNMYPPVFLSLFRFLSLYFKVV